MKSLLKYLKDYKKECFLAPLFKMLEACFELFVPLVVASIVDKGIAGGDKGFILSRVGIMVLLALIGLSCSMTAQYFSARAAVGFSARLRHALFAHIESLSFTELDGLGSATLITRLTSDINQLQNGVNMVLRLFLRSPFIVFGAMIMAFTVDVRGALIFAVTIPLLSIVVFGVMLISIPLFRRVQKALDALLLKTRENLIGVRVIRAFQREEEECREFDGLNQNLNSLQRFVGKFSALMNPLTFIIINLALVILLYTGALQVDTGVLSQGQVIALVNYMSQILVELVKLANLIITVTKAVACGNRVAQIFSYTSSQKDGRFAESGSREKEDYIVFDHVSLTYDQAKAPSLTDISFHVRKGETVGIIGPTGSGKSSLVQLLGRYYDISGGSLRIDGLDVREYRMESLRKKVGMVMQKSVLFTGSIRDNLLWGNDKASDDEIKDALKTAQALDVLASRREGLDAEVEQGGKNFSGGQRQRLSIARTLVGHPDILVLDDSASALDYATDAALRSALKTLPYKPTVFIVSQRTASMMQADQILVLDDGKLAGKGTHKELLETCPLYKEIYDSQYKNPVDENPADDKMVDDKAADERSVDGISVDGKSAEEESVNGKEA